MKDQSSNLTLRDSQRIRFWQRIGPHENKIQRGLTSRISFSVVVIPTLNHSCEDFGVWKEDRSISFLRISMARTTSSSISCCLEEGVFLTTVGIFFSPAFSKSLDNLLIGISSNSLLLANWEKHHRLDLGGSLCPCILFQYKV